MSSVINTWRFMVFTGQELKINLIINRQISGFYRNVTETNVNRFLFVFDKKKYSLGFTDREKDKGT